MNEPNHDGSTPSQTLSTVQREEAVKRLTTAFADDAIPVDEFERRVADVYAAQTPEALRATVADLPPPAAEGSGVPALTKSGVPAVAASGVPAPIDGSTSLSRRPAQKIDSILSSIERRVPGVMPERLDVRSILSSLELDLRRTEFPPGVTEIHVDAILASVEIELPQHVQVEDEGSAFMGTFSVRGRSRGRSGEAGPIVRITGRSLLSSVEIELDD